MFNKGRHINDHFNSHHPRRWQPNETWVISFSKWKRVISHWRHPTEQICQDLVRYFIHVFIRFFKALYWVPAVWLAPFQGIKATTTTKKTPDDFSVFVTLTFEGNWNVPTQNTSLWLKDYFELTFFFFFFWETAYTGEALKTEKLPFSKESLHW